MGDEAEYIIQQQMDGELPSGYGRGPMSYDLYDGTHDNDDGNDPVEVQGYVHLIANSNKAILFGNEDTRSKAQWCPISQIAKLSLLDDKWQNEEDIEDPNADEFRYYFAQSKTGNLHVCLTLPRWLAEDKEYEYEEE